MSAGRARPWSGLTIAAAGIQDSEQGQGDVLSQPVAAVVTLDFFAADPTADRVP